MHIRVGRETPSSHCVKGQEADFTIRPQSEFGHFTRITKT